MAIQSLATQTARIGKFKAAIIAHAEPVQALGITGNQVKMPKNQSNVAVFRQWLPYGATAANPNDLNATTATSNLTQEGVTPPAETLAARDVSVVMQQYHVLYSFTDRTMDFYEDDVPAQMKKQVGERTGLIREKVRYGTLKGCTNRYFAGGTTRATVDEAVSKNLLRKITRNMKANHAQMISEVISGTTAVGTLPIERAYLVFGSTNLESDFRDLADFKTVAEYPSGRSTVHECEIGSFENFRIILTPELDGIPDSGAAVGVTGLMSTSGTLIDVYPLIVCAEDAWAQVTMSGMNDVKAIYITPQSSVSDPVGQRGYVGSVFYFASVIQNDGWMAVAEVGAKAL